MLSGRHPLQLSERRQSASRVLKVFLEARSPGPVRDRFPAIQNRPFTSGPDQQSGVRKGVPWSCFPTVKRPALLWRRQMWRSSTLSEPVRSGKTIPSAGLHLSSQRGQTYMSDSVHFRVFACCKRLGGTVRKSGNLKADEGVAGTGPHFPRLLTLSRSAR